MNGEISVRMILFVTVLLIAVLALFIHLRSEYDATNIGGEQAAPASGTNMTSQAEAGPGFEQVVATLNQSETGRHLLKLKEVYDVNIQFEAGNGFRYRQGTSLILLDSTYDPVKASLYFAHQMHHARIYHEGKKAALKTESRPNYINLKLQEEAEGMIISIQVKMELEKSGFGIIDFACLWRTIIVKHFRLPGIVPDYQTFLLVMLNLMI